MRWPLLGCSRRRSRSRRSCAQAGGCGVSDRQSPSSRAMLSRADWKAWVNDAGRVERCGARSLIPGGERATGGDAVGAGGQRGERRGVRAADACRAASGPILAQEAGGGRAECAGWCAGAGGGRRVRRGARGARRVALTGHATRQVEATLRGGVRPVSRGDGDGAQLRPWLAALEARDAERSHHARVRVRGAARRARAGGRLVELGARAAGARAGVQ